MSTENTNTVESTELVTASSASMINDFAAATPAFYCSFKPSTDAGKVELYNAMNNADVQLADHIGQLINMRDLIIEPVEIVKEETGEVEIAPRVIIIDTDGNSYTCVSKGIYNALRRICSVFGMPTWADGLPVKVRQVTRGARRIYTLDAAVIG